MEKFILMKDLNFFPNRSPSIREVIFHVMKKYSTFAEKMMNPLSFSFGARIHACNIGRKGV